MYAFEVDITQCEVFVLSLMMRFAITFHFSFYGTFACQCLAAFGQRPKGQSINGVNPNRE